VRWVVAAPGLCFLSACGILSGLDNLTVADGGPADVTVDALSDDAMVTDVGDVVDGGVPDAILDAGTDVCSYGAGNPHCFGTTCGNNTTCCVLDSGAECAQTCTQISLDCTTPDQCTSDAAPICCLANVSFTTTLTCPYVVTATAGGVNGTSSLCTSLTCENQTHTRICTANADCPTGLKCREGALSTDPNLIFGICL
jgi:hypothetical protein